MSAPRREKDPCAYCGRPLSDPEDVPAKADNTAWAALATEHAPDCEWIETRAHGKDERAAHTRDADCTVLPTGACFECDAFHGDPCPKCGGRAFHVDGCSMIEEDAR